MASRNYSSSTGRDTTGGRYRKGPSSRPRRRAKPYFDTDVWVRRESPPKRYVRSFYHVTVYEPRDSWTHTVTGTGSERGVDFEFSWVDLPTDARFALDLDDYLHTLVGGDRVGATAGNTAD